jgi:hypothetical protein
MSHNVHGAWQDLYQFHLNTDHGDTYTPKLDWGTPRPQLLFALGLLSIGAVRSSLHLLGGQFALNQLEEQLDDLSGRIQAVDVAHEKYLSQKNVARNLRMRL